MPMRFDMNVLDETELIAYALRELYMQAGYRRYRMSKFEEYDLYSRNKSFLGTDEIVTFTDTNGKLMALKPDVTLSIIRNTPDGEGAARLCYNENVYRSVVTVVRISADRAKIISHLTPARYLSRRTMVPFAFLILGLGCPVPRGPGPRPGMPPWAGAKRLFLPSGETASFWGSNGPFTGLFFSLMRWPPPLPAGLPRSRGILRSVFSVRYACRSR